MLSVQCRISFFIAWCIPIRLALVALAKRADPGTLKTMGYISLIPGLVMTYLWFTNGRQTSSLVGKLWWAKHRIIHGLLWLAFSASAITGTPKAWTWLALDVLVGIISWFLNPGSAFNQKL